MNFKVRPGVIVWMVYRGGVEEIKCSGGNGRGNIKVNTGGGGTRTDENNILLKNFDSV